jgi:hypothetical protein
VNRRWLGVLAVAAAAGLAATAFARPGDGDLSAAVEPARAEVRQCLSGALRLLLGSSGSRSVYAEATIAADGPLQLSRTSLATVLPAGYTQTVPIRVAVPAGAPAGEYRVRVVPRGRKRFDPVAASVTVPDARCVPRERMTATATSAQLSPNYGPQNAIDGVDTTLWHIRYTPTRDSVPQSITLALDDAYDVSELAYQPRLDGNLNGTITAYEISVSADGQQFLTVASGSWAPDATLKTAALAAAAGVRFVRLEARAGVANYASAAEIVLFGEPAP